MKPPLASAAGSAFAEARTSITALLRLVFSERGHSKLAWAVEISVAAVAGVLVLHSVESALSVRAGGRAPLAELLTFVLGVALNLLLLAKLSQRVLDTLIRSVSRTTQRLLDAMGRLDLEQFEQIGREEISGRVNDDAVRIVSRCGVIIQVLIAVPTIALSMIYVATISAQAALVSLAAMLAIALLIASLNRQAMDQIRRDRATHHRMQEPITDLLAGFKQLKQHGPRSQAIAAAFEAQASALRNSRDGYHREFFARDTLSRQSYFVLLGAISFVLPLLLPAVASTASQLLVATSFIFRPLTTVVMAMPLLAQLGAAWQRLSSLADRMDTLATPESPSVEPPRPFTRLSLRSVTYQYPAQGNGPAFSVGPCDLDLVPGVVLFITGANGSGKSTFIKLLCGLYRCHGGELAVDSQPIHGDAGPSWRNRFSAVFAEFALFERAYGLEDVEPTRVAALLEQMELGHKVRFENGRFDTVNLSTGQRKRLALVVALLQDRAIYVFDEWAADQDPHFREAFYRQIVPDLKARGKAVVAVTHDDDFFDACDQQLHFVHGQMVTG